MRLLRLLICLGACWLAAADDALACSCVGRIEVPAHARASAYTKRYPELKRSLLRILLAPLRADLGALFAGGHRACQFLVLQRQLEPVFAPVRGVRGGDDDLVAVDRAGGNGCWSFSAPPMLPVTLPSFWLRMSRTVSSCAVPSGRVAVRLPSHRPLTSAGATVRAESRMVRLRASLEPPGGGRIPGAVHTDIGRGGCAEGSAFS